MQSRQGRTGDFFLLFFAGRAIMIMYDLMRRRSIEFAVIANPNYRSLRTSSLSWCAHWFGMTMLFGAPTSLQIPIKAIGLKPQTDHLNL